MNQDKIIEKVCKIDTTALRDVLSSCRVFARYHISNEQLMDLLLRATQEAQYIHDEAKAIYQEMRKDLHGTMLKE